MARRSPRRPAAGATTLLRLSAISPDVALGLFRGLAGVLAGLRRVRRRSGRFLGRFRRTRRFVLDLDGLEAFLADPRRTRVILLARYKKGAALTPPPLRRRRARQAKGGHRRGRSSSAFLLLVRTRPFRRALERLRGTTQYEAGSRAALARVDLPPPPAQGEYSSAPEWRQNYRPLETALAKLKRFPAIIHAGAVRCVLRSLSRFPFGQNWTRSVSRGPGHLI
jgi:hypothetical protein